MKPFSQKTFDQNDPLARKALRGSSLLQGFLRDTYDVDTLKDGTKYAVDFLGYDLFNDFERGVEVETKKDKGFRHGKFRFPTLHILDRKLDLWKAGCVFVTFDDNYEFAFVTDSRVVPYVLVHKYCSNSGEKEGMIEFLIHHIHMVKVKPDVEGALIWQPTYAPEIPADGW